MRWKTAGVALAAILAVGAALAIWITAPTQVRRILMNQFEQALGRPVTAESVEWHYFPPGVRLTSVRVPEVAPFEGEFFLADTVELKMTWGSLIRREAQLSSVVFVNPIINLRRNTNGMWNLETFWRVPDEERGVNTSAEGHEGQATSVDDWRVEDGTVVVITGPGQQTRFPSVNASLNDINVDSAFPVHAVSKFDSGGELSIDGMVGPLREEATQAKAVLSLGDVRLEALQGLLNLLETRRLRTAKVDGHVSGTINLALPSQGPLPLTGEAQIRSASLQLPGWKENLRDLNADLKLTETSMTLENLTAKIGAGAVRGTASMASFNPVEINFDLDGDVLDLSSIAETVAPGDRESDTNGVSNELPGSEFHAQGRLRLKSLKYGNLALEPFSAHVKATGGTVVLNPVKFGIYDGSADGVLTIRSQTHPVSAGFQGDVQNVDVDRLVSDNSKTTGHIRGKLNGDIDIRFQGQSRQEALQSAKGKGSVEIVSGRLSFLDLPEKLAEISPIGISATRGGTPITRLAASYSVMNGTLRADNLILETPKVNIGGSGALNLMSGDLQLKVTGVFGRDVRLTDSDGPIPLQAAQKVLTDNEGRVVLPFKITGTLPAPHFAVDLTRVGRERILPGIFDAIRKNIDAR